MIPTFTARSSRASNSGSDSYRELQFTARYQVHQHMLNGSYVRSRAFGNLNDFNQFFGNLAQPVTQPDARGRLPFDEKHFPARVVPKIGSSVTLCVESGNQIAHGGPHFRAKNGQSAPAAATHLQAFGATFRSFHSTTCGIARSISRMAHRLQSPTAGACLIYSRTGRTYSRFPVPRFSGQHQMILEPGAEHRCFF
jgi:hypothetical protein